MKNPVQIHSPTTYLKGVQRQEKVSFAKFYKTLASPNQSQTRFKSQKISPTEIIKILHKLENFERPIFRFAIPTGNQAKSFLY